jgi:Family of unknown function (DUF5989)
MIGFWKKFFGVVASHKRTWLPPIIIAIAIFAITIAMGNGQRVTEALYRIF